MSAIRQRPIETRVETPSARLRASEISLSQLQRGPCPPLVASLIWSRSLLRQLDLVSLLFFSASKAPACSDPLLKTTAVFIETTKTINPDVKYPGPSPGCDRLSSQEPFSCREPSISTLHCRHSRNLEQILSLISRRIAPVKRHISMASTEPSSWLCLDSCNTD
jgi:hypothetical protein